MSITYINLLFSTFLFTPLFVFLFFNFLFLELSFGEVSQQPQTVSIKGAFRPTGQLALCKTVWNSFISFYFALRHPHRNIYQSFLSSCYKLGTVLGLLGLPSNVMECDWFVHKSTLMSCYTIKTGLALLKFKCCLWIKTCSLKVLSTLSNSELKTKPQTQSNQLRLWSLPWMSQSKVDTDQ